MATFNLFKLLSDCNCYGLIGKIYCNRPDLLNVLIKSCDSYNYKINKGKLNINGLLDFITIISDTDLQIFDDYLRDIFN